MARFLKSVALALSARVLLNLAQSADESNTGALLKFPYVNESSPLYGVAWEVAPAHYGIHDYGGSLTAYLVLPMNESYHYQCTQEPAMKNEYVNWVETWNVEGGSDWIMLIDRGNCYFVDKTQHAQNLGASGVIVIDRYDESLFNMWPPENYNDDLDIPSVLLGEKNGETLMQELNVSNWNTYNLKYPNSAQFKYVVATIEWGLPHDDDRVEYELYTSAIDPGATKFKKHWETTGVYMDYHNYTMFTPHVYLLDGSHWSCDDGRYRCAKQCTNGGRYCSVDPEYDLSVGLDGMDVVQENLRSMCVWKYVKDDPTERNQSVWWDYQILWDHQCSNSTKTFTADCSFAQMDLIDDTLSDWVRQCIEDSGGYGYTDGENDILEYEMNNRYDNDVYSLPTVMVNEYTVQGNIDCDEVTLQDCQVLDAICAGFIEGTAPYQCYETPAPTPQVCPDEDKDCRGVCYGRYVTDQCGQCLVASDPRLNNCLDCNGTAFGNATVDCEGNCGGSFSLNDCGICLDSQSPNWDNEGKDCAGECEGNRIVDQCGQCLLASDPAMDSCVDCAGVAFGNETVDCTGQCGGSKKVNPCGLCIDESTQGFDTEGMDCNGDCEGRAELDSCGNCLDLSDAEWDACRKNDQKNGTDGSGGNGNEDDGGNGDTSSNSGGGSKTKTDYTATVVIAVSAFVLLAIAVAVIYRMYNRQREVDSYLKAITDKYELMDDQQQPQQQPGQKNGGQPHSSMEMQRNIVAVPQNEDDSYDGANEVGITQSGDATGED